jgi:hypothetical protein
VQNAWTKLDFGPVQLVCCTLVGMQSDRGLDAWLDEYEALLTAARDRGYKLVELLDISRAAPLTAKQRRTQADWNSAHEALMQQALLGVCFVASSVVMRGVITAVLWLKPMPVPHAVCAEIDQAVQWGLERCSTTGLALSNAQREQARRVFVTQAFVKSG